MIKTKETAIRHLENKKKNFRNKEFDLFRDDFEVVIVAVKSSMNVDSEVKNISERLQDNPEVILEAIKSNFWYGSGEFIEMYASENIKKLVGNNDPIEVLEFEIGKEKSILMANDFRERLEEIDLETLHAEVQARNSSVVIPDSYITEIKNSIKEPELKSNVVSIAENKNDMTSETQIANAPTRPQRRLKL